MEMIEIRGARDSNEVLAATLVMWRSFKRFFENESKDAFAPFHSNDPCFCSDNMRLLLVDGEIVATTQVFLREHFDGYDYRLLGGIGNVATLPDFRGRGYSMALLSDSVSFMRRRGVRLSTLYAGPTALYEKLGYQVVPRRMLCGRVSGNEVTLGKSKDITHAMAIYEGKMAKLPGAFKRTVEYWRQWVVGFQMQDGGFVCDDAGRAYLIFREDSKSGEVHVLDGGSAGGESELVMLIRSSFPGRVMRIRDIDLSHVLYSSLSKAIEDRHEEVCSSLMFLSLDGCTVSTPFCETPVDHF